MFMGSHSPQRHSLISSAQGATEVWQQCGSSVAFLLGLPAKDCCSVPADVGGRAQCHFTDEEMDWERFPISHSPNWNIRGDCYFFLMVPDREEGCLALLLCPGGQTLQSL